ncbi:transporter substrate-binding domain-containing protein [Fructobacillus sp. W13]|uniref:Transporter substrate-binding domain-containing protein n=1 Tax=Fructobacillus apis TaxID=2935017 RepID=A0ABT0ZPF8_9LACO|nr:transporter substrate-binding domain-containing protein [Fructobacillus apis]MCO0831874.1 transporter substrate-binding domain-containing protein [Fructobacillus apis]
MSLKVKIWVLAILTTLSVVVVGSVTLLKQSAKETDDATKVIKMGSTGLSFPNSYKENGQLKGFDVEVAEAAAKAQGYKVKWVNAEFDGLWGQLDNGHIQGIANAVEKTAARENKYDFSKTYLIDETKIAVRKDSAYQHVSDLKGQKVAGVAGSNKIALLNKYDSAIPVVGFENRDIALQSVLSDRVEGVVNSSSLAATINKKNLDLRLLPEDISDSEMGMAFAKTNEGKKYRQIFNEGLQKIKNDGTLKKLSLKYFQTDLTQQVLKENK